MGPRKLAADFDDLDRGLALRQDDFREPDSAESVEIEGVIRAGHPRIINGTQVTVYGELSDDPGCAAPRRVPSCEPDRAGSIFIARSRSLSCLAKGSG
jgi:hypothetical protein